MERVAAGDTAAIRSTHTLHPPLNHNRNATIHCQNQIHGKKTAGTSAKTTAKDIRAKVLEYISRQKNNTFNYRQVAYAIDEDTPAAHRTIALQLAELAFDGDLLEVSPGNIQGPAARQRVDRHIRPPPNGKNSVVTDEDGESIFVAERNSRTPLNGDKVRVIVDANRRGVETEAEVVEILEQKEQTFIGTLRVEKQFGVLVTDSKVPRHRHNHTQRQAREARPATKPWHASRRGPTKRKPPRRSDRHTRQDR